MPFLAIGTWIKIGIVVLALGAVAGGYMYVTGLQHRIEVLTANNAKLQAALAIETANKQIAERRVREFAEAEEKHKRQLEEFERVAREAEQEAQKHADVDARAEELQRADPATLEADLAARDDARRRGLRGITQAD